MTDRVFSLLRLLQTADSSFPSGAFAFSSGLETLAAEGRVGGAADVRALLADQIVPRWLGFDRLFLREAFAAAADPDTLLEIDRRCHLQNTVDRLAEASRRVGRALLTVHARIGTTGAAEYRDSLAASGQATTLGYEPVVQGIVGAGLGLACDEAEAGALNAVVMGFTSAAVRLGRLGALDAQSVLAALADDMAAGLARMPPAQPGAFSPLTEIAALRRPADQASLFAT
ncbi:Urease accessory protein UreF [Pseudooceanicola batsensis HTCC2597]|uniref:Urease accessory protein UreF n=1 Tax=Pseudooceanicola batsensis (strain ATCC BAA-863 / DSM 15984 / KCTC 12145 / HTCC2597) TaxID=252305 RepID=A3U2Y9_PSEBH|nr:urease accessory UreF family protein [Pseudooceanicola batsensis]EAQ01519.1 Urease accessory protein UreF [Pseudooceanicola batsensis HTCC2597]